MYVLDITTQQEVAVNSPNTIGRVTFSPDSSLLAIAGENNPGKILFWSLAHKREVSRMQLEQDTLIAAAFSPDNRLFAAGDWGGPVIIGDVGTGKKLTSLIGHKGYAIVATFSPDGKTLATGGSDGYVKLWNVATWREIARFFTAKQYGVGGIAFSPDGNTLLAVAGGEIYTWHAASFSEIEARERREKVSF